MNVLRQLVMGAVCSVLMATANAAVIYDNMGSPVNSFQTSDLNASRITADNFTLQTGQSVVSDAHWTGFYSPGNTPTIDNFTIQIYLDSGGVPASIVPLHARVVGSAGRTDTGLNLGPLDLYQYSANFLPIILSPATTYWLAIVNDTALDANDDWRWGTRFTNDPSDAFAFQRVPGPWISDAGARLDFQLTNDTVSVPEPGTLALLAVALAALGLGRRRKQ